MDIGQGAGLSGASGVRPFLPPLLAGALAGGDIGIDFDDTSFEYLEEPPFLLAVFALAIVSYALERRRAARAEQAAGEPPERGPLEGMFALAAIVVGAMLFAGSLADGGHESWPGIIAGVLCATLGYLAVATLFARVRRRLDREAQAFLPVYADLVALGLAALAIFVPPVSFVALAAFLWLILAGRRAGDQKYAGLRVLR
jgi:uncharacterized membrane protein YidH (DUF202 family)